MQRRAFILTQLRSEGVRSVCEIGCGEGGLLMALCQPAAFVDEFPPWVEPEEDDPSEPDEVRPPDIMASAASSPGPLHDDPPPSPRTRSRINAFLRCIRRVPSTERELHVSKVVGCDISESTLPEAVAAVKPPPAEDANDNPFSSYRERWEPLSASIYKGSLAVYNGAFRGRLWLIRFRPARQY